MAEPPKTLSEWRSMSEEQLLLEAQSGVRGLGAVIEMSRRQLHEAQHRTMRRRCRACRGKLPQSTEPSRKLRSRRRSRPRRQPGTS